MWISQIFCLNTLVNVTHLIYAVQRELTWIPDNRIEDNYCYNIYNEDIIKIMAIKNLVPAFGGI